MRAAPSPAVVLGFGGLIPFVGLALLVAFVPLPWHAFWLGTLHYHGGLILSFVGALHWGYAVHSGVRGTRAWMEYGWSVLPAFWPGCRCNYRRGPDFEYRRRHYWCVIRSISSWHALSRCRWAASPARCPDHNRCDVVASCEPGMSPPLQLQSTSRSIFLLRHDAHGFVRIVGRRLSADRAGNHHQKAGAEQSRDMPG